MLWALANNFDEYGYSLRRDLNDDRGYASFIDLMKFVSKYDNVLFVFDCLSAAEFKGSIENFRGLSSMFSNCTKKLMPLFVMSDIRENYDAVVFCQGFDTDPDCELLKQDGIEVISSNELHIRIKQAGPNQQRLDRFYEAMRAIVYAQALGDITQSLSSFVAKAYSKLDYSDMISLIFNEEVNLPVTITGDDTVLMFGIPEMPDFSLIDDEKMAGDIDQIAETVYAEYGNRNEQFEELLNKIHHAWLEQGDFFANRFHDAHPDLEGDIEIDASELVSFMMFDHAKDAYDAGVPLEDIIC